VFRTIKLEPDSDRFENDAEHSFLLATLGCAIAQTLDPALDLGKVSQYALVHDLVEVYAGDTTIWASDDMHASKAEREEQAMRTIHDRFGSTFPWAGDTIMAYEKFEDPESCFVYALDKIIPYVVMLAVDHQPVAHNLAVYEEKMSVARRKVAKYPALLDLFEAMDAEYKRRGHFFTD
jgi:5'-deoxynucleotidase YfbR-like HD superfamily hydrolase